MHQLLLLRLLRLLRCGAASATCSSAGAGAGAGAGSLVRALALRFVLNPLV
jgi:hypothetical protein